MLALPLRNSPLHSPLLVFYSAVKLGLILAMSLRNSPPPLTPPCLYSMVISRVLFWHSLWETAHCVHPSLSFTQRWHVMSQFGTVFEKQPPALTPPCILLSNEVRSHFGTVFEKQPPPPPCLSLNRGKSGVILALSVKNGPLHSPLPVFHSAVKLGLILALSLRNSPLHSLLLNSDKAGVILALSLRNSPLH